MTEFSLFKEYFMKPECSAIKEKVFCILSFISGGTQPPDIKDKMQNIGRVVILIGSGFGYPSSNPRGSCLYFT